MLVPVSRNSKNKIMQLGQYHSCSPAGRSVNTLFSSNGSRTVEFYIVCALVADRKRSRHGLINETTTT